MSIESIDSLRQYLPHVFETVTVADTWLDGYEVVCVFRDNSAGHSGIKAAGYSGTKRPPIPG